MYRPLILCRLYSRVLCTSRSVHSGLFDSVLKDALHNLTGCLHPISTYNLFILVAIQPAGLHHLGATLFSANRNTLDPDHFLHFHLVRPLDARQQRLKSRLPFVPAARKLLDNGSELDICVAQCTDFTWKMKYLNSPSKLYDFIPRVGSRSFEMGLPKPACVKFNRANWR